MANDLTKIVVRFVHRVIGHLVGAVLRPGATYVAENFRLWENHGYHITPVHFYSPIPDTRVLDKIDFQTSQCPGIDLRPQAQLQLLQEVFARFAAEYNALPRTATDLSSFYLENDAFQGVDPHVYYCMLRHFQPQTVIEVGSGHSTLLGAQTARRNGSTRYICVDPWPRDFIAQGVPGIEFIRQKVEDLDLALFAQLQPNDILFVDSSHVVRTASDVCFIMLEVLPRLQPGVIIHFHDIFLPFEYPKVWLTEQHYFWTEQYLLQAYLAENPCAEILFANRFMAQTYPEEMRQTFPSALWVDGGSFWIRKKAR